MRWRSVRSHDLELSSNQQQCARALFTRLIDPGTNVRETTRRRANLRELTLLDEAQSEEMRETANAFTKARLLTTDRVAGIDTIEVSHEALIAV